jgi:Leucine-rich repeat (LRR) protein
MYSLGTGGSDLSSIPTEIGLLVNLVVLELTPPKTSTIPTEMNLQKLKILSFTTPLMGTLPSEMFVESLLTVRFWRDCPLISDIPTDIGRMVNADTFSLTGSSLSGTIPTEIGNCIKLTSQGLWRYPHRVRQARQARGLDIEKHSLYTLIPPHLGKLPSLWWLNIANCGLYGSLPGELPLTHRTIRQSHGI